MLKKVSDFIMRLVYKLTGKPLEGINDTGDFTQADRDKGDDRRSGKNNG